MTDELIAQWGWLLPYVIGGIALVLVLGAVKKWVLKTERRVKRSGAYKAACGVARLLRWAWRKIIPKKQQETATKSLYRSTKWRRLRADTLAQNYETNGGYRCEICGGRESEQWHCDHIKPRSTHPELALDPKNVRIACDECNVGRGNRYSGGGWQKNPRLKNAS